MTAPTVHPPGRLISKPATNVHAGMLVCPSRWHRPDADGPWATVLRRPWWQTRPGRTVAELRVDVRYPTGESKTLTVPEGVRGGISVVMPG